MSEINLNSKSYDVMREKDSIVIVKALTDIPGGVILDTSAYEGDVICSGHIIVKDTAGNYKPLGVSGSAYAELNTDVPVGVLRATILKNTKAPVVTSGQINGAASPYPVTKAIATALPRIEFLYCEPK